MTYDADIPDIPNESVLARRPWYLVGILVTLLSIVFSQPLLVVAGLLIIVLGGVPEIWYRYCLSGVTARRSLSTTRVEIGDEIILTLQIENQKVLPLPRLEVEDEAPEGLPIRGAHLEPSIKPLRLIFINTLSLWAYQRVTRRYHMRAIARGTYLFGPMKIRSGDPFGLLSRERIEQDATRLLVYPLIVPLERLGIPARAPFGDLSIQRRLLEDPLRIAGTRPYVAGDDPRRIHWKATARTGALQSKVFEPTTRHTLVLFVDLRTYDNPVLGYDPDLLELGLCTAASVAAWALDRGLAVGMYANGNLTPAEMAGTPLVIADEQKPRTADPAALQQAIRSTVIRLRVPPSSAPGQIERIQELLARLIPYYAGPIRDVIAAEMPHLPFGSTVLYVGTASALGDGGRQLLTRLRARGHAVVLLLTGEATDALGDFLTIPIGDAETWKHLYGEALASRGIDRQGRPLADEEGVSRHMPTLDLTAEAIQ